jgi:hypothetical protein
MSTQLGKLGTMLYRTRKDTRKRTIREERRRRIHRKLAYLTTYSVEVG